MRATSDDRSKLGLVVHSADATRDVDCVVGMVDRCGWLEEEDRLFRQLMTHLLGMPTVVDADADDLGRYDR